MSGIVGHSGTGSGFLNTVGNYTPTVSRVDGAPQGSPPAAQMIGKYRTMGDVCFVNIEVAYNGFSGGSGQWYVTAPFINKGRLTGLSKARIYMSGDSADFQLRLHANTNQIRIHTPSNDGGYSGNATYVIIYASGSYIFR